MKLAIIIPVYNRKETTLNCLEQLSQIETCGWDVNVIVVDDGSTDGTAEAIKDLYPEVVVVAGNGDLWWTGAINEGVRYALDKSYDSLLFLNDDLKLTMNFLCELVEVAGGERDVLVSSIKLIERQGHPPEILTAGFNYEGKLGRIVNNMQGESYSRESIPNVIDCDMLTGASLLVPANVVNKVGLLDEERFPHNWGDIEFTSRVKESGYRCLVATHSHVFTEYNPNYHRTYYLSSTRKEYISNLFENRKYDYGLKFLYQKSFMHRPIWAGSIMYLRGLFALVKHLVLKLALPRKFLEIYKRR